MTSVWVFNGEGSSFPSGVFTSREAAEAWIAKHALSGTLTAYPLDTGIYEWAISKGYYSSEKPVSAILVGRFSSAYQDHAHFIDGKAE